MACKFSRGSEKNAISGLNKKSSIMNATLRISAFLNLGLLPLFALSQPIEVSKPNILFILADDLGYTDLSCMGSKYYETPNIDQIARNGMVFTNGYAACQVCSMSGSPDLNNSI
jgi:hypothetical protein